MARKVAIAGYKQTRFEAHKQVSREMLVFNLVKTLLGEMELGLDQIDTIVTASNDFYDGRTISIAFIVDYVGGYLKNETKVEEDGAFAVLNATMRILSGVYDLALVVGYSKASEFNPYLGRKYQLDPTHDRQMPFLNEVSAAALQAQSYMTQYGVTEEHLAKVAAKNLNNASKNPYALRQMPGATVEKILDSSLLYAPLRELMCYPFTDGACAILLAEGKRAKQLVDKPIWIKGVGHCQDTYYLGDRTLFKNESLSAAAQKAYRMAGVGSPSKEIDVAEVHESFAHQELMAYEALGFCEEGEGGRYLDAGHPRTDGALPVNPSGGALSSNAFCATGMVRILEAAMQLQGRAGEHQIDRPKTALAHGQEGICAQSNIVFVLQA